MNLRPPSVTVSTHTSAFNADAFQFPTMPNAQISLWTQSVHCFSFPPRPLRTAPSRFARTIRFGSRPPLIRRSVPAHKSLLTRNVVSMLLRRVMSRARLYEVIRWSGLLRCAPIIRSNTRWCTVRSLALCSWRRLYVLPPYKRASIASALNIRVLRESATFGWS